tara:strand:- start:452 stop:1045 length:594 start_codon:yes stop_codon:yes gene_type:complete
MKVFKINGSNSALLNQLNGQHNGTVLFFHPQCSHCTAMKPEWEGMKQKMKRNAHCNLYEVDGQYMDRIQHPMKQTVDGFPTILNVNNGKLQPFEKERNTQNMINFVLSNLPNDLNVDKRRATKKLKQRNVSFFLNGKKLKKERTVSNGKAIRNTIRLQLAKKKKRGTAKGKGNKKPQKRGSTEKSKGKKKPKRKGSK